VNGKKQAAVTQETFKIHVLYGYVFCGKTSGKKSFCCIIILRNEIKSRKQKEKKSKTEQISKRKRGGTRKKIGKKNIAACERAPIKWRVEQNKSRDATIFISVLIIIKTK